MSSVNPGTAAFNSSYTSSVQPAGQVYSPAAGPRRAHGGPETGDPGERDDNPGGDNYENTGGMGDGKGNAGDPEGYVPLGDGWIMMLIALLYGIMLMIRSKKRTLFACLFGLLTFGAGQVFAANRTYDGSTYIFWNIEPSSNTWWDDDYRVHYISLQKTDGTWTSFVAPTAINGKLAYYIVPTGTYQAIKLRSIWHEGQDGQATNTTDAIEFDSDASKNYIFNFSATSSEATWSYIVTYPEEAVLYFTITNNWWNNSNCWHYAKFKNINGEYTSYLPAYNLSSYITSAALSTASTGKENDVFFVTVGSGTYITCNFQRKSSDSSTGGTWDNNTTNDILLSLEHNKGGTIQEANSSISWTTYQPTSTCALEASSTTITTAQTSTLTPSLTSNTRLNKIKSTSYAVTTNPGSAGSVTPAGVFSATAVGTYTVTATITYNAKGFPDLTSTTTATQTITVTDPLLERYGFCCNATGWGESNVHEFTNHGDGTYSASVTWTEDSSFDLYRWNGSRWERVRNIQRTEAGMASNPSNGTIISVTYNSSTDRFTASEDPTCSSATPITLRFDNTLGWKEVWLFVWKANGVEQNILGAWPGVKLTMADDGYYGYTFDGTYDTDKSMQCLNTINNFIFNDGTINDGPNTHQTNDDKEMGRGVHCFTIAEEDRAGWRTDSDPSKPMRYDITENDCSPVEAALHVENIVVNAEGTQVSMTLATTPPPAAAEGATYHYQYQKDGSSEWTDLPGNAATAEITLSEEGYYTFQVIISKDGKTWTATTEQNIKFQIKIRVKAFDSFTAGGMQIKYWTHGDDNNPVDGENTSLAQVGSSDWYECTVKGREFVKLIVKGAGCGTSWVGDCNGWKRSVVCGPFYDDVCILISEAYEEGTNYKKYSLVDECGNYQYRYKTVDGTKTYYSNGFNEAGEQVSMYVAATPSITFQSWNGSTYADVGDAGAFGFESKTEGDVYVATVSEVSTGTLTDIQRYTGKYYIRTDIAPDGGWNVYQNTAHEFTYFGPNANFPDEWYNHYWMSSHANVGTNVKASVANSINPNLSTVLPDFIVKTDANIRFEYKPTTNYFGRQFIKLSNAGDDFISIYGTSASPAIRRNGITLVANADVSATKPVDFGNWIYTMIADVQLESEAVSDVQMNVRAKYNIKTDGSGEGDASDNTFYLIGANHRDNDPDPQNITLLGDGTSAGTYRMQIIYDFKTNRLMPLWTPGETEIVNNVTAKANMMMLRKDDNQPQTLVLASSTSVSGIQQIYGVLQVTKTEYQKRMAKRDFYYWISLPFDCQVSQIFGIGEYGSKWTVQVYRGDKRAQLGYTREGQTFWAEMYRNEVAMMEAYRGYVIRLILDPETDFKRADEGQPESVYLYFPSSTIDGVDMSSGITIEAAEQEYTPAWRHTCHVSGCEKKDSHWNVVGIPGFRNMTLAAADATGILEENELENYPKFYYKYSFNAANSSANYTPALTTGEIFQPMNAYMVQFHGWLNWRSAPESNNSIVQFAAPKRRMEETENAVAEISLAGPQGTDKTFLWLAEGSHAGYDDNADLCKALNAGVTVYSVGDDGVQMAGNCIPPETQRIDLGLRVSQPGEYTFSLPKALTSRGITLMDKEQETTTLLDKNNYTVFLEQGSHNSRFAILLGEKQEEENTPTGLDNIQWYDAQCAKILRNGQLLIIKDGKIYNAQGVLIIYAN